MIEVPSQSDWVRTAEIDLHKVEFSSLRDEILRTLDAERQLLNLTLVAVGAGLGVAPILFVPDRFFVLLLFPFVFHIILWEMLNSQRTISNISNYLSETVIPRVNSLLKELGAAPETNVLGWELSVSTRRVGTSQILITSITPTRHWMPILAIAALMMAYGIAVNASDYSPLLGEVALIFINLIFLIWAAAQNTILAMRAIRQSTELRQKLMEDGAVNERSD